MNKFNVAASSVLISMFFNSVTSKSVSTSSKPALGVTPTRLGCNAHGNTMGRNFLFADLVKQSTFGWPTAPSSQNTSLDNNGWPSEDFSVLIYNEPGGYTYPYADLSGIYTVTSVDGCASVSSFYAGVTVLNSSCNSNSLLAYVEVSNDGELVDGHIALVFTNTKRSNGGGGISHLSILQPGFSIGTDPDTFTPNGVNMFKNCSLIRFLEWTLIGHTQWDDHTPPSTANWTARPKVGAPSYAIGGWGITGLGAPWEVAANLAKAVGADIWLNVPSSTDEVMRDDYITNLIQLMDKLMPPDSRIFLEHGNECFFGNNQCYADDVQTANITVMQQGDPHRLNYGLETPPNITKNLLTWGSRMYTWTAWHISEIAGKIVGPSRVGRADTPGVRVVPVLGALGNYAQDLETKASWLFNAWGSSTSKALATVNIGAYVGSKVNKSDPNLTPNDVIESLLAVLSNMSTSSPVAYGNNPSAEFATIAAHYGLALHAYEGGPDTSGGAGSGALLALANANKDARMADVVVNIISNWQSWGNGMFNYFDIGAQPLLQPWGSYTTLWDFRNTSTPKTEGLARIISNPPASVTAGWPIPVLNHSASFYVGYYTKDGLPPPSPIVTYLQPNSFMSYLVRVDQPCPLGLNVTVYMSNFQKTGGDPLGVSVGVFLPMINITAPTTSGNHNDFEPSAPALFDPLPPEALPNKLITVRLHIITPTAPKFSLRSLDVTCRTS
jgi:hypothetical protein